VIIDTLASFSVAQSLVGLVAPAPSTKWLNLQENRTLLMQGNGNLYVEVRVTSAFSDGGAGTAFFVPCICTSDSPDGTGTVVAHVACIGVQDMGQDKVNGMPATQLGLNKTLYLPLPRPSVMASGITTLSSGIPAYLQQYLGMVYLNTGSGTQQWTAGAVSARLVSTPGGFVGYKDGIV